MFFLTLQTPIDGILQRWPSDLRWRLEGGYHHRTPRVWRPFPSPRDKDGRTTRHWVLSSESVGSCWFGNYCFVGCLTRVRTDTSACNSSTCLPVETRHPQMKLHQKQTLSTPSCAFFMISHYLTNSKCHFFMKRSRLTMKRSCWPSPIFCFSS